MANITGAAIIDFWPEIADPEEKPPLKGADAIGLNVGILYYAFVEEGSRMEPTIGQIWPR